MPYCHQGTTSASVPGTLKDASAGYRVGGDAERVVEVDIEEQEGRQRRVQHQLRYNPNDIVSGRGHSHILVGSTVDRTYLQRRVGHDGDDDVHEETADDDDEPCVPHRHRC